MGKKVERNGILQILKLLLNGFEIEFKIGFYNLKIALLLTTAIIYFYI